MVFWRKFGHQGGNLFVLSHDGFSQISIFIAKSLCDFSQVWVFTVKSYCDFSQLWVFLLESCIGSLLSFNNLLKVIDSLNQSLLLLLKLDILARIFHGVLITNFLHFFFQVIDILLDFVQTFIRKFFSQITLKILDCFEPSLASKLLIQSLVELSQIQPSEKESKTAERGFETSNFGKQY